ncbi:unnamed protein product, partial [Vitis vinifera]|uniref:Uncharacterized protein n=1 Tax=Vitis vinifera TaxID=29760 RepID=D7TQZ3_VITVI
MVLESMSLVLCLLTLSPLTKKKKKTVAGTTQRAIFKC